MNSMNLPGTPGSLEDIARDLAAQASAQLKDAILDLLRTGVDIAGEQPMQLECSLSGLQNASGQPVTRFRVASVRLDRRVSPPRASWTAGERPDDRRRTSLPRTRQQPLPSYREAYPQPAKRRKMITSAETQGKEPIVHDQPSASLDEGDVVSLRKSRLSENPVHQPSTLNKFISGVWDSLYASIKLDPTEVIEQWQALEASGQPRLLTENETSLATRGRTAAQGVFTRMNVLTRKVSQTSRTCRSLEVIVQAHWIQCFDDRVLELTSSMPREKAKKQTIAEACMDFSWTEKELRNKMGIWRGYFEIKESGGWAALVFAGAGLYRFCKYRGELTKETFDTLGKLRHRFEVAADTLHPRWRQLLGIVGRAYRTEVYRASARLGRQRAGR